MPYPDDVREELADILAKVQGCEPDAVQPDRRLKEDLGVDSITIVEIGEELGRRFHLYLSDQSIDGFVTVKDAINAVVHHDGATPSASSPPVPATLPVTTAPEPLLTAQAISEVRLRGDNRPRRQMSEGQIKAAGTLAIWMGIAGAAIGLLIGVGSAAVIGATGIGPADLPPLSVSTTVATETPTTASPTPTPTPDTPSQEPTLRVSSLSVEPGERFALEGNFPSLGAGATLTVQVKDPGGAWDDFPVDTKTKADGAYSTKIYTSRTGKREFRLFHKESSKASPSVTVEIG